MKRKILLGVLGVMVAGCGGTDSAGPSVSALIGGPPPPPPSPTTYSGRATVVTARVLFITTTLGDTGPLPAAGGSLQRTLLTVTVPGVLGARAANAATRGGNNEASSEASVADASLTLPSLGISASLLASNTAAQCTEGSAVLAGASEIADLVVNGQQVTVSGDPNQLILVPGGRVVVNEQVRTGDSITISALHVAVNGVSDVVVARTHSDIHCGI